MNVEKTKKTIQQDNASGHDVEAEFHIALGWLAALSVSIAALATIS